MRPFPLTRVAHQTYQTFISKLIIQIVLLYYMCRFSDIYQYIFGFSNTIFKRLIASVSLIGGQYFATTCIRAQDPRAKCTKINPT